MITIKKVLEHVYVLKDRAGCCANLVIGEQKALLFDTGSGVDDMKEAVRNITGLPLMVINSHGHFDHIGGNSRFDEVYLSELDFPIIEDYDVEMLNRWMRELTKEAVNVLMTNPGSIGEYGGMNMIKNPCLPLIAIPTTAGTSSEITNVSALIDTEKVIKYVVIDNNITASDVIADPEFTRTAPAGVTAATGMDAITHAVESYVSNMASPLTKYHSIKGLEILYNHIERVVANGGDMEAREQMMLGCIITGFGFSNANLGLVHAIAHTLSAHFGLAHGMANACVLPYVTAFNSEAVPEAMTELAKAVGLKTSGDIEKDRLLLSDALLALTKKLKIKTLSEQGIEKKDFDMLAEDVLKEPVLGFNPRQGVTKEEVLAILEQAY